jgi:hypothetical protein
VISVDLARALRTAGLSWEPANGDWFVVDASELLQDRLVLSDMTVDIHRAGSQTVLGFNGTTEWALDSVGVEDTLWLPGEAQLRELLGPAFSRLGRIASGSGDSRGGDSKGGDSGSSVLSWEVELVIDGSVTTFSHPDCAEAYGRAMLHLLTR